MGVLGSEAMTDYEARGASGACDMWMVRFVWVERISPGHRHCRIAGGCGPLEAWAGTWYIVEGRSISRAAVGERARQLQCLLSG